VLTHNNQRVKKKKKKKKKEKNYFDTCLYDKRLTRDQHYFYQLFGKEA
jgi:hypothetical protein